MPDGEVEGSKPGKPHNPYEDNIVHLGACRTQYTEPWNGLWVQIVREEGDGENEALKKSNAKHGKKGKGEFTFPENACNVLNTVGVVPGLAVVNEFEQLACEAEPSDMVAGKVGTSALVPVVEDKYAGVT
jgi:hypothetical protein